ncbi:nuclease-related domain-containing protein [Curtobacterium sp. B8]|uniref:nuclease-related domain-containing protein n=1 Tax=Curtobacterium sp. B8 TaxID=95611 RepID=UPI0035E40025
MAERTEAETARFLAPLAGIGYHLLADRRWPGSKHAQVDMIVVGSAGVFIVDTKAWREVSVHGDRIHRGQEDVTDDVARLADLVYGAEAALAEIGLPPAKSTRSSHSPTSAGCTRTSPRSTSSGSTTSSVTSRSATHGCPPPASTRCSPL